MPKTIRWIYKGHFFKSEVLERPCQKCGAVAVVRLPELLLEEQPDDTTHVCHPVAGGCNHGFAEDFVLVVSVSPDAVPS